MAQQVLTTTTGSIANPKNPNGMALDGSQFTPASFNQGTGTIQGHLMGRSGLVYNGEVDSEVDNQIGQAMDILYVSRATHGDDFTAQGKQIKDLGDPVDATDAVTKRYLETHLGELIYTDADGAKLALLPVDSIVPIKVFNATGVKSRMSGVGYFRVYTQGDPFSASGNALFGQVGEAIHVDGVLSASSFTSFHLGQGLNLHYTYGYIRRDFFIYGVDKQARSVIGATSEVYQGEPVALRMLGFGLADYNTPSAYMPAGQWMNSGQRYEHFDDQQQGQPPKIIEYKALQTFKSTGNFDTDKDNGNIVKITR